MKKAIVGLGVLGALIALRPVVGSKMRGHCERMAGKCKEMMASQSGQRAAGTPGCCQEMMAAHTGQGEKTETPEHSEPEAPQFIGDGEAVAV